MKNNTYIILISLIVALGGFLLGFDGSVISGALPFITKEFSLTGLQVGFAGSSLTLAATIAMMIAGPVSNKFGRKKVLLVTALLYLLTGITTALSTNYTVFIIGRMIGGFGVGAALLIAPMYIAEIAPAAIRGRMVSFNQLNIVIGLTIAYFSNYLLLNIGDHNWRWMLGVQSFPALLYFISLLFVPESPRWLAMKGFPEKALQIMKRANNEEAALAEFEVVKKSIEADKKKNKPSLKELFSPGLRFVLTVGVVIAFFQQATGINAIMYYTPMIFEQTGIGRNASFATAVGVGLTNLLFTIIAMWLIDKLGRKPLLLIGMAGMAIALTTVSLGFRSASYKLTSTSITQLEITAKKNPVLKSSLPLLISLKDKEFKDDVSFKKSIIGLIGEKNTRELESNIVTASITINAWQILIAMMAYVAFFALAIGPIVWVLLSELFPNRLRGIAISFCGFINSVAAFTVVLIFPWQLNTLGNSSTFLLFAFLALIAWIFVLFYVKETKGKSLEEIEQTFVGH